MDAYLSTVFVGARNVYRLRKNVRTPSVAHWRHGNGFPHLLFELEVLQYRSGITSARSDAPKTIPDEGLGVGDCKYVARSVQK